MNALASEVAEPEIRIPGRDLSWINAIFSAWGEWIWEHRDYEGYPTSDSVTSFLMGAGGGTFGSRVPLKDTPEVVRMAHALFILLPEHEGTVVFAEFVPGANENGQLWTREQKCAAVKMRGDTFSTYLWRAKARVWKWSRR